jgi:hypothetical protein
LVPATNTPAPPTSHEIVIAFVIVKAPKPPGSKQLISPPATVFEMAPAKVLHGAVLLHGFTSSPTPETQVLAACAFAGGAMKAKLNEVNETTKKRMRSIIASF